jgi:hypothetical protein
VAVVSGCGFILGVSLFVQDMHASLVLSGACPTGDRPPPYLRLVQHAHEAAEHLLADLKIGAHRIAVAARRQISGLQPDASFRGARPISSRCGRRAGADHAGAASS